MGIGKGQSREDWENQTDEALETIIDESRLYGTGKQLTTENYKEVDADVRWVVGACWSEDIVVDVLFIKQIEKIISRELNVVEVEALRFGEPLFYQDRSGRWDSCVAQTFMFPSQLQLRLEDLTEATTRNSLLKKVFMFDVGGNNETH